MNPVGNPMRPIFINAKGVASPCAAELGEIVH